MLVAISLMMSGIVKLRVINLIGAVLFAIYGLILHAYPVAALNALVALVNIYYLFDIYRTKEFFRILPVQHDSEYLHYFLKFYREDIRKFQPAFSGETSADSIVIFILRNTVPAGLILGKKINTDTLVIDLDYVVEGYRDLKIAKYVYTHIFEETNSKLIYTLPGNEKHDAYLHKMGFVKTQLNDLPAYCLNRE
ncbi:MAG: hypothetical protein HY965_08890 [Ignavibacteriales bacterium]|nr:hypothetical protein [Ignavibacteriales bacterium]